MIDDLKNREPADRSRLKAHADHEVRYWIEKWDVSKEQLPAAVRKAGPSAEAVAGELRKTVP